MNVLLDNKCSAGRTAPVHDFTSLLLKRGIKKGSRSWQDYEAAKRVISRVAMSVEHYDKMIAATVEYLGL
jgi:hypothetical protein